MARVLGLTASSPSTHPPTHRPPQEDLELLRQFAEDDAVVYQGRRVEAQ